MATIVIMPKQGLMMEEGTIRCSRRFPPPGAGPGERRRPVRREPAPRRGRALPRPERGQPISRNMLASKETNAQTNHRIKVDMTAAIALRKQYKDLGIKISYNDMPWALAMFAARGVTAGLFAM